MLKTYIRLVLAVLWDEDVETVFLGDGHWTTSGIGVRNKSLIFEFGGNFTVERVKFYPRQCNVIEAKSRY